MRRPRPEERGSLGLLAGAMLAALCGAAALAVDLGLVHAQKRNLQAAVDAAALSAARAPAQAAAIVAPLAGATRLPGARMEAQAGRYLDDPALPPAARFLPGAAGADAVRVDGRAEVTLGLSRVVLGRPKLDVAAHAVAEHRALGAISLGSGLATLDAGVLNAALGALLGTGVSLDIASYRALAGAQVRLLELGDRLGGQIGLSAGTYGDLAAAGVAGRGLLGAAGQALAPAGLSARPALDVLAAALPAGGGAPLSRTLNIGTARARPIGSLGADRSYATLTANALDLVTATAALGGRNAVALPGSIAIPGIAQVAARVKLIEPPQGVAGPTGLGPVGTRVTTAQARLLLEVRLLALVNGGVVTLPLLLEAAPAVAEVTGVSCQADPAQDARLRVRVETGAARARIGALDLAAFDAAALPATLPPAPVLNLTLTLLGQPVGVRVLASAGASLGAGSAETTFTAAEAQAGATRTIAADQFAGSLVASLARDLRLTTEVQLGGVLPGLRAAVQGLLDPILATLVQAVAAAIIPALAPLDQVADQVLAAAGLRLGTAELRAGGIRCGVAGLVL